MSNAKTYNSRDNATAALRRAGINKTDYDKFLNKTRDGLFVVDMDVVTAFLQASKPVEPTSPMAESVKKNLKKLAKEKGVKPAAKVEEKPEDKPEEKPKVDSALAKLAEQAKAKEAKIKAQQQAAAEEKKRVRSTTTRASGQMSIGAKIREMVDAGKNNDEIWAFIQPEYKLSDDKRWYPAWYRADKKRKGL